MIKSKRKFRSYILIAFLLPIASSITLLGLVLLIESLTKGPIGLATISLVLLFIGSMFLFFGVYGCKRIEIDPINRRIAIIYLGLFRQTYTSTSVLKFNNVPFQNYFGSFDGILIEDERDFQHHFSKFDTKNFDELKIAVKQTVNLNKEIKINFFKPILKPFFICCAILLIIIVTTYVIK